ncbi:MAG: nucleoside-diphosphate kinase [Chloroflexota bacterium]|nr:nucleoside-diphosphate kinase [Chloroflexota bacterium]
MERTLVLVKPDGLQRGLAGRIIARLEDRGLKIVGAKMLRMDMELARTHYSAHVDKPFFAGMAAFMTSSPLLALAVEGKQAVDAVRALMGATDPQKAAPGTIRADLAQDIERNLIHGSDSPEAAAREIGIFFEAAEMHDYALQSAPWVVTGS